MAFTPQEHPLNDGPVLGPARSARRTSGAPTADAATAIKHPRRISIIEGAGARLSDQTRLLLRTRLRLAGSLIFAGSLVFLIWTVVTGNITLQGAQRYISWTHIGVVVVVSWLTYELWRPRLPEWRELRTAELLIFGSPALLILVVQLVLMTGPNMMTRVPISTGAWCALLFTYAMFIPNSWRRAARIIGPTAMAPILLAIVVGWRAPQRSPDFWENLSGLALLLLLVAAVATYGTHVINSLRLQAFEALQLGQYRLRELLGSGGMGDVWLAEHQLLKRPCAIKLIDPGRAADPRAQLRFEREVRATARLSHWNTVEIFDYGRTDDGTFYYVMEYLPGMTLAELIESHGPMPPARAVHLLRQACNGLREAHAQELIHRDIKPGNIIAAFCGGLFDIAKVVDFGLVELRSEAPLKTWNTDAMFSGSPLFMAPEHALGGAAADPRSDIYSLGAVGYYLLTGRPPFEGTKAIKIVIAHAHDPVIPPTALRPEIPLDLELVILRCLAKAPSDRYESVEALEEALSKCSVADQWRGSEAADWWRTHEPGVIADHARTLG